MESELDMVIMLNNHEATERDKGEGEMTRDEIEVWWDNKPEVDKLLKRPIFGHWEDVTNWLIQRVRELEERIQLAESTRDDALAYAEMYRAKVVDFREGIEGILNQKDLISFTIQKQLEELIAGKEK